LSALIDGVGGGTLGRFGLALIGGAAGRVVVALPGPPRELQPMVRDELVPYLSRRFGTRLPGRSSAARTAQANYSSRT